MDISIVTVITALLVILLVLAGMFFTIRYFIKYYANMMRIKSDKQQEIEKMKIDDLG